MTDHLDAAVQALAHRDDRDRVVLCLALRTTLYLRHVRRDAREAAVKECVRAFVDRARENVRWLYPTPHGVQAVDSATVGAHVEVALARLDRADEAWELDLHAGTSPEEASDLGVEALVVRRWEEESPIDKLSYVSFRFPLLWFETRKPGFPSFVLECCERTRPTHGFGGIALITAADRFLAAQSADLVRGIAARHPGVEIDNPVQHLVWVRKGLKGVNWLTVVGDEWLPRVGGLDGLRSALPSGATVHPYPGGCVIQAGRMPEIGDVNRRIVPSAYRDVSALLKPIRIATHGGVLGDALDPDQYQQWLARFDA